MSGYLGKTVMNSGAFILGEDSPDVNRTRTMKLPEDPVEWLSYNHPGREILQAVHDGKEYAPLELRKACGMHPETFRRAVHTLELYGLVEIHAKEGEKLQRVPKGWGIQVVVEVTRQGKHVLGVLQGFSAVVREHAKGLPRATRERWLTA